MLINRTELISAISEKSGATKKSAGEMLDAFMDTVKETVAAGNSVSLTGFGVFECKTRKARTAHSPVTGETIQVPERKAVAFRPGKHLKDAVAGR